MVNKNRLVEYAVKQTRQALTDGTFAENYPNVLSVADVGIETCAKPYEVEITPELRELLLTVWLSSMAVQAALIQAEPINPTIQ